MSSATTPTSSPSLLSSAPRNRKQIRKVTQDYPPLDLPLRWRNLPDQRPIANVSSESIIRDYSPLQLPLRWRNPSPDRTVHNLPATVIRDLLPLQTHPVTRDSATDINFAEGEQFTDCTMDTLHDRGPPPLSSCGPMLDSAVEATEKPFYELGDEKNPASPNHPFPPLIYSPLPLSSCNLKPTSVSATAGDHNSGNRGLVGEPAYLESPLIPTLPTVIAGEVKFRVTFHAKEEEGIPGAVIMKNLHLAEVFPKSIAIEDFPGKGRIHFDCNFWVYNVTKYTDDRVYNYAYYNNLGNPDLISGLRQPVLGGSHEYPYLHCGKTARPPTKTDPESESRLFSPDMNIYVLHDERFSHLVPKENMRSIESLLFDLDTIKKAINNFSEENKLGESGFGCFRGAVVVRKTVVAQERLLLSHYLALVALVWRMNPKEDIDVFAVLRNCAAELDEGGPIVSWVNDPMHGNTIRAPCGLKTRPVDPILKSTRKPFEEMPQRVSISWTTMVQVPVPAKNPFPELAIPPLIQILETVSLKAKENSATILVILCKHSKDMVYYGIPPLLWLLINLLWIFKIFDPGGLILMSTIPR